MTPRERRTLEIGLLKKRYGKIEVGPDLDWVLFKRFPLPPGWNAAVTELLILIPAGYPITPPDNFYVRNGLRLADGRVSGNYSEGQNVLGASWAVFSYHVQGWNGTNDYKEGDCLLGYMIGVERRLRELG